MCRSRHLCRSLGVTTTCASRCGDGEICVSEEIGWAQAGGTCTAIGVVCGLVGIVANAAIFRCSGTTTCRSIIMGVILGSFLGGFCTIFAYYTIAINGRESAFPCDDARFGQELGTACLERQSAYWVRDTFVRSHVPNKAHLAPGQ